MMKTSILNLIVVNALVVNTLPLINRNLSVYLNINYTILYAGVLIINTFLYSAIGSGVAIYSGLFNISENLYSSIELQSYGLYVLTKLNRDSSIKYYSTKTKTKQKQKQDLHWSNYIIDLDNISLLSNSLIKIGIKEFWNLHAKGLNINQHMLILFRVEEESGVWSTLGQLQKVNKDSLEYFINFVTGILEIKADNYKEMKIQRIAISYGIRDGEIESPKTFQPLNENQFQNYKHYKLPNTMDPFKYGKVIHHDQNQNILIVQIGHYNQAIIKQNLVSHKNHVDIYKKGEIILSYNDTCLNEGKFERNIGKNKYLFVKHDDTFKLALLKVNKSGKKIASLKPQKPLTSNKIITMDFETFVNKDKKDVPYLVSWFDGIKSKTYFLTDFNSPDEMTQKAIKDLMRHKYKGWKVYLHNLGKFDSVFLLDNLCELGFCKPLKKNGRYISLTLTFNSTETVKPKFYTLEFRDSLQLLLAGLRKLAIAFNVDIKKGIFPYSFVTSDNLDYIGPVPGFEYFSDVTHEEYSTYCKNFNNNWSLREESEKYCINDSICLYQILIKFNQLIFDNFKVNINKYPTLSSLSYGIFRTIFLKTSYFISQISGKVRDNIKLSYTGGATDMYIPTNQPNELIYCYDINSLYPSVMKNFPMPVGKPIYFEGDIRKVDPEAFGFFYCNIITPKNLEHPILQTHVKTKAGIRTVAALGHYKDMIFSAEMDNGIKLGYKFEILWGYTFEKGNIFNDFVSTLYNIRLNYPKTNPMNYIAKLIMNNLYGRFGMDDQFTFTEIVNKEDYPKFEKHNIGFIDDVIPLSNNYLITLRVDYTNTMLDTHSETHNINIAISSAITSYGRIIMSQFKNHPLVKLFYTDTDSIYTNLSPEEMNNLFPGIVNSKELGKLKLENISTRGIFIAPKCYYLKSNDNKEIYKIKGLNKTGLSTLTSKEFESLLIKNNKITKTQTKWIRSISESTIYHRDDIYTIQQTSNKRELIYNSANVLIGTKPYLIEEDKSIK